MPYVNHYIGGFVLPLRRITPCSIEGLFKFHRIMLLRLTVWHWPRCKVTGLPNHISQ